MRPALILLLLTACDRGDSPPTAAALAPAASPASAHTWVDLEARDGDLDDQLATHCAASKAADLDPFVELTAIWCAPCQVLRKSLKTPAMQDAFAGTYIISVDVDLFGRELEENGLQAYGVPAIFALGPDCLPTGAMITGGAWAEDTPEAMAPPLKAFFRGEAG